MSGPAVAWSLWLLASVFTALNVVFLVLNRDTTAPVGLGSPAVEILAAVGYLATGAIGALIATRRPGNPVGWTLSLAGLALALAAFASEYGAYALVTDPGALPAARGVTWLGAWAWWAGAGSVVTFVFLLFPDGRLPSPRWRPVAWVAAADLVAVVLLHALAPGPLNGEFAFAVNPFGIDSAGGLLSSLRRFAWVLLTANAVASMASVFARLRAARGDEREQVKWLGYACAVAAVTLPLWALTHGDGAQPPLPVQALVVLALLGIPLATGAAVLKYRLYDIDVVINRTVVFGALAGFVTAAYSAIVVGIGAAVGDVGQLTLPLSLMATALVAVAFQPVRERVQRLANELVYGERITPYEVITGFSHRMTGALSIEEVLPQMAEVAAKGVGGVRGRVRLFLPGGGEEQFVWPSGADDAPFDRTVAVVHQGGVVGDISVAKAPGDHITDNEDELLSDLAAQAGLAMRNLRLTGELQARLEELQASRQRIVAAQDQERRRMERDIHDGAQQQLVSMAVKLGLAKRLLAEDPSKAADLLEELRAENHDALETLRDLARGIFPPLLVDKGPVVALEAHVAKLGLDATVEAGPVAGLRFDPEVEAAVYFCTREALQNASKHAPGAPVTVRLTTEDGWLHFSLTDTGPGFDPRTASMGSGVQNMADRLEAVGGTFTLTSAPGQGTCVAGKVPARPRPGPHDQRDQQPVGVAPERRGLRPDRTAPGAA
ncbi:MAG: sensor histidine kinase [Actinomycetota bacterium]|nr:sensor histidine kinase [Actinomycetota bacterium]